ncbi:autotransporter domain-containing protein [Coralliovum pocilloporae]|uniref:autotransporter family protein n=1 Tax=Coralliovum pocilloporae TaxID=3066369 RepID=UPI003307791F
MAFFSAPALADVETDGSLGGIAQSLSGSTVMVPSSLGVVNGGALFHSFSEFDVSSGQTVTFTGNPPITDVITRVTGGEQSVLNGQIVNSVPNGSLLLLNESGFLLKSDVSFNVSDDVFLVTADRLTFPDGAQFSALPAAGDATSSAMIGQVEFSGDESEITVDGSRINLAFGQFSLVSDEITIRDDARIRVNNGRVNLVARGGNGTANVTATSVTTTGTGFGDILISDSVIDTSTTTGPVPGLLTISGNLEVTDNALLRGDVPAAGFPGGISITGETAEFTDGGFLEVRDASGLLGNADFDVDTVTFEQAFGTRTLFANLTGSGDFVKTGEGTLVLPGDNSITGTTFVQEGQLSVTGLLSSSDVEVQAGALLSGNGQINQAVSVASGGFFVPGGVNGTTFVTGGPVGATSGALATGDLTLQPGSVFIVEINETTSNKAVVNGTVSLNGANVGVLILDPCLACTAPGFTNTYTIIENDLTDPVNGMFAGVIDSPAFFDTSFNFAGGDGNDVDLTLTRNSNTFSSFAQGENQLVGAGILDSFLNSTDPDEQAFIASVIVLSEGEVRELFDDLAGEANADVQTVAADIASVTLGATIGAGRRVGDLLGVTGSTLSQNALTASPSALASQLSYAQKQKKEQSKQNDLASAFDSLTGSQALDTETLPPAPRQAWAAFLGGYSQQDGTATSQGVESYYGGGTAGVDIVSLENWRLGLSAGYYRSSNRVEGVSARADVDSFAGGFYASYDAIDWYVDASANYVYHDIGTERTVTVGLQTFDAEADYGAHSLIGGVEAGIYLAGDNITFQPYVGMRGSWTYTESFTESGGGVTTLSGESETFSQVESTIGFRVATVWEIAEQFIVPSIGAAWVHRFNDDTPETSLSLAGGGGAFTVQGLAPSQDLLSLTTGFAANFTDSMTGHLQYQGDFASDSETHTLIGGVRMQF